MFAPPHKKVLLPLPPNLTPKPLNVPNHEFIRQAVERGVLPMPKGPTITPLIASTGPVNIPPSAPVVSTPDALRSFPIFTLPAATAAARSRSRSPLQCTPPQSSRQVRKIRCRYFYETGYCMRGSKCFYDHGTDPVVVQEVRPTAPAGDSNNNLSRFSVMLPAPDDAPITTTPEDVKNVPRHHSNDLDTTDASNAPQQSSQSRQVRRIKCRYFYEKGYCMRGDSCFYDHGSDPVIIQQAVPEEVDYKPEYKPDMANGGATVAVFPDSGSDEGYNPECPAIEKTSPSSPPPAEQQQPEHALSPSSHSSL